MNANGHINRWCRPREEWTNTHLSKKAFYTFWQDVNQIQQVNKQKRIEKQSVFEHVNAQVLVQQGEMWNSVFKKIKRWPFILFVIRLASWDYDNCFDWENEKGMLLIHGTLKGWRTWKDIILKVEYNQFVLHLKGKGEKYVRFHSSLILPRLSRLNVFLWQLRHFFSSFLEWQICQFFHLTKIMTKLFDKNHFRLNIFYVSHDN